jgi:hypothetical protein
MGKKVCKSRMHQDIKIIDFEIFYNFTVYESDNIDIKRKQWNCHHARNNGTVTMQETMELSPCKKQWNCHHTRNNALQVG